MAISFDNSNQSFGNTSTTATCTLTIAPSKNILWCYVYNNGLTWRTTAVACTDGAMTEVSSGHQVLAGGGFASLFYFVGASTVSQTITITVSALVGYGIQVASYNGAKQSGQPDANTIGTQASSTSYAQALTTVADNCWMVFSAVSNLQAPTAGTNSTSRQRENTSNGTILADSNGVVHPAGSFTMTVNDTGSGNYAGCIASFLPDTTAVTGAFLQKML